MVDLETAQLFLQTMKDQQADFDRLVSRYLEMCNVSLSSAEWTEWNELQDKLDMSCRIVASSFMNLLNMEGIEIVVQEKQS